MGIDSLVYGVAALVPFVICFGVARAGHARTAWWLPAGIGVLTIAFVFLGFRLGADAPTGAGVVRSVLLLGVPAVVGGIAGVLLGRRRA